MYNAKRAPVSDDRPLPTDKRPVLPYSRPVQYRRIKIWFGIVLLTGIGLQLFTLRWGDSVYQQAGLIYWQWKCMNYTASAKQTVSYNVQSTDGRKYREGDVPDAWRQFSAFAGNPLSFSAGRPSGMPDGVVFLHKCISPNGTAYLVCVTCYNHDAYNDNGHIAGPGLYVGGDYLVGLALRPGGIGLQPVKVPRQDRLSAFPFDLPTSTIYAGQVDPNDASHFSIRYEVEGNPDVIDGYIDSQGAVTLTPRKPPGRVQIVK